MGSSNVPPDAEPAVEFERELTELIATAFARGVTIERTWEIPIPASAAPDWTIEIKKTYTDDADYDPESID